MPQPASKTPTASTNAAAFSKSAGASCAALKRGNKGFDSQCHDEHDKKSGQETTDARWSADMGSTNHFLFGNRLRDLKRNDRRGKQTDGLDDPLRRSTG